MARNFMRDVFDLADEQGWTRRPKEQGYQLMPPRATARPGYESIYIHIGRKEMEKVTTLPAPTRQTSDSCANCTFSGTLLNASNELRMICRRHPPKPFGQAFPTQNGQIAWATNTAWPGISTAEWCGEHVAKSLLSS